ncbi:Hypothetical protein, putative [Bodo saltans]|uniref:Uncharacterized protein n=1 Tax=Bodo saltans TaxID=75058 RepID=A0A0S4J250_BODSA|nr:Hypothetical protein, putative [Bodo saltans]|eukprot:CUG84120.1 Hypothetical protein, putative [Bodo saltans]
MTTLAASRSYGSPLSSSSPHMNEDGATRSKRLDKVFHDYSITDEYCTQPYIPHCNVFRAVRKAIGTYPSAATVQQFLDDDVERSDTQRVTQGAFEYLCSICEISGTMEATAEAQRASRAILRGRSSVPIEELRDMIAHQSNTNEEERDNAIARSNALTLQEFAKVIAELEKDTAGPLGESVSAAVVENMLMGPSRHSSSNAQSLHSTATFHAQADQKPTDEEHVTSANSSQLEFPAVGGSSSIGGGVGVSIALSDQSVTGGSPAPQSGLEPIAGHTLSDQISDVTVTPAGAVASSPPVVVPPSVDPLPAAVVPAAAKAPVPAPAKKPATQPSQKDGKKEKSGSCCSIM